MEVEQLTDPFADGFFMGSSAAGSISRVAGLA